MSATYREALTALGPSLLHTYIGATLSFSAILLPQLQEARNGNIVINVSKDEASWIASSAMLSMTAGCLIGGLINENFGRKRTHVITCLPFFIGWMLISFAYNVHMIMTGRILTGFLCGILNSSTGAYIGEISRPKNRGFFLGGISLMASVGLLATHIMAIFLSWQMIARFISIISIISWTIMCFTPESPAWYVQKEMSQEAQEALNWLRKSAHDSKEELESMLIKHKEITCSGNRTVKEKFVELTAPEFWKPLSILVVYFVGGQWAGLNVANFYSVTLLKQILGDQVNGYVAAVIVQCSRLASSISTCILLKKIGRRKLGLISSIGTFTPVFILSGLIYFTKRFNISNSTSLAVLYIVILLIYIYFVTACFLALPMALLGEILPLANRSIGGAIVSCVLCMAAFSVVKTMPAMFDMLGTDGAFLTYGSVAVLTTVFILIFMPETKGKTLDEIEEYFKPSYRQNQVKFKESLLVIN